MFGTYAAQQFEAKHGKANVEREREIPWGPDGMWTGHADLYVRSERLLVEVVSSVSPAAILGSKIEQVRRYLRFDPEAEAACVFVINPSDLDREDLIPVRLHQEYIEAIDAEVAQVIDAVNGGPLPDCPCATPNECKHSRFCAFTEAAWDGWEPPAPTEVDAPQVAALVSELYLTKKTARELEATAAERKDRAKELQAELADAGIVAGMDYKVGPFKLRRIEVAGRETFSLAKARQSGEWTPLDNERFSFAVTIGQPSERWTVERVSDEPLPLDFGEAPPF